MPDVIPNKIQEMRFSLNEFQMYHSPLKVTEMINEILNCIELLDERQQAIRNTLLLHGPIVAKAKGRWPY